MLLRVICVIVLAMLIGYGAGAQQEQYLTLKKFTQNDGLSSYNITKIVRDRLGYLWIGTQDGLNRFDGRDFLIFKDDAEPRYKLYGNNVSDIVEDTTRNILWVSTSYGGITGIDLNTSNVLFHLSPDGNDKKLLDKWVRTITIRGDILWIGTNQGLLEYDIIKKAFLEPANPSQWLAATRTENIHKLLVDHEQNLWVCSSDGGLTLLPPDLAKTSYRLSVMELDLFAANKELLFWYVANAGRGKIVLATSLGARTVVISPGRRPELEQVRSVLYNREIFSCALDENGEYWFSDTQGFYRFNAERKQLTKLKDADFSLSNWQGSIYQIYPDQDHNIWLGCQEGLALYHSKRSPFVAYGKSSRSDTRIQHAYSILPVSDSIMLCGAQDGIYLINSNNRSIDKIDNGSSGFCMYQHAKSETFISNDNGLMIFNGHTTTPALLKYPSLALLKSDIISSAFRYNDSLVIFGSQKQKGIYIWNTATSQLTNYNNNKGLDLYKNFCNTIYSDNNNKVWILSQSFVLSFDPVSKKSKAFKIKNPLSGEYCPILFDMCQVRNHYYFAAYGVGVIETDLALNPVKVISTKDHLANNGVYKILSYNDSLLFITTNNGLSVLNLYKNEIRNYYQSDGLHSSAFEELCAAKKAGKIYVGGVNGFTMITPQLLPFNAVPPHLYLNNIKTENADGEIKLFNAATKKMDVPSDVLQTSFYFSCVNYSNPERVSFAYKIAGDSWIELGHQNFIDLVGINPGKYKLEVKAANEDGIWSLPTRVDIVFMPKWYQSLWFKFLAAVCVLAGIFGIYRLRINRLKSEQEIRNRLAIDLHDEIGSTLNSVKVFANLGLMEEAKDGYLEYIKQNTQEAIQSLKDIIWMMSEKPGTVEHLVSRWTMFAEPICKAKRIDLKIEIANESYHYMLGQMEKQNLYLIGKEAINNSIKYSSAGEITFRVSFLKGKPVFVLADNGTGFSITEALEGNGLKNMKVRARRVKYDIDIRPGQGTVIELRKM